MFSSSGRLTTAVVTVALFGLTSGVSVGPAAAAGRGGAHSVAKRLNRVEAQIKGVKAQLAQLEGVEARVAQLEGEVEQLLAKEEIRTVLLTFATVVDSADISALLGLLPRLASDFTLKAVEFGPDPEPLVFEGVEAVLTGFGPIMLAAQANLMASAINVDLDIDGDMAVARFKFANSVIPPEVINDEVTVKVLLFAANTANFRKEDGIWKLAYLELVHSLAYPGSIDAILEGMDGGS